MFINFNRYERSKLTPSQKEFLHVLIPFSRMVQEYTKSKCKLAGVPSKSGIYASIICADAIIKSEWNTNKISKKYNNLNLIEADEFWFGKTKDQDGALYRIYECWFDYASDLSDHFIFSGKYNEILLSKNLDEQIDNLAKLTGQSPTYCSKLELLIGSLGLFEFDS